MPRQRTYTASEAAAALGISIDTLRRWDRAGRIRTRRDAANRRVVTAGEIARLRGGETRELWRGTGSGAPSARSRRKGSWLRSSSTPARFGSSRS